MDNEEIAKNLATELSRGTLVLCVLHLLSEPVYGYSLMTELLSRGVKVQTDTLYPLLRRLENQGLVMSEWDRKTSRPRKYYMRDLKGTDVYNELKKQWMEMSGNVNVLLLDKK